MTRLTRSDIHDILTGCTILGTGGGGEMDEGLRLIEMAFEAGKSFNLISLDDAPDNALICTPYMLGAISDLEPNQEAQYERLPRIEQEPILLAYSRLEAHLGQEIYGTVPCEMGGSNTAVAFFAAAMNGHKIINADPAGRAVPEITHSTYYLNDLPAAPIVAANAFGEVITLENIADDLRAETLVRALSVVSRNDIAAIDHALPANKLRGAIIPGTITKARELGRVFREALAAGEDTARCVAQHGSGAVVFRGSIRECDWRTEEGFTLGSLEIAGIEEYEGHSYRIALKNENMAAWLDGEVHATIPDLICLFDTKTGAPITNPHYQTDQEVAVVVLPAPEAFLSPKGLACLGPGYAGIDAPFVSPLSKSG